MEANIEYLAYEEEHVGNICKWGLDMTNTSLLTVFKSVIAYRYEQCDRIGTSWTGISITEFDEYCISDYSFSIIVPSPTKTSTSTPWPRDLVAEFRQGIKRDVNLPTLKDNRQCDQFQCSTWAQARGQDEVLDPEYQSNNSTMEVLFNKKQEFMFAIFCW